MRAAHVFPIEREPLSPRREEGAPGWLLGALLAIVAVLGAPWLLGSPGWVPEGWVVLLGALGGLLGSWALLSPSEGH